MIESPPALWAVLVPASTAGMVTVVTGAARMFLPMAELVDLEKERAAARSCEVP